MIRGTIFTRGQIMKMNIILTLLMGLSFLFTSCVIAPATDSNLRAENSSQQQDSKQISPTATQVKRMIKDVDYRHTQTDKGVRKKVAILPFVEKNKDNEVIRPEEVRKNAKQAFINELNNLDQLIVVDSEQLNIDPKKYIKTQEYDLAQLAKDIKKQGISSLIEGQIIDVRLKKSADQIGVIRNLKATYEVVVRLRIMNVRSEQEVFHTVKTVTVDEENTRIAERVSADQFFVKNPELVEVLIKDAFLDFSSQIKSVLDEVSWEGRIAAIKGDKIYLNVGRISGVQIGDILKVVEDGSELYDPELGYHLGQIKGKVKGTIEVVNYFGQDGAVGVLHSGAGFKDSDRVELYQ